MRGLTRFLLGGALGAALGIVIAQRRKQKLGGRSLRDYWEAAGAGVGTDLTEQAVPVVLEPEPKVTPTPEPEVELGPEIGAELEPEPEPEAELEAAVEAQMVAEPEPVVEQMPEVEPKPEPELETELVAQSESEVDVPAEPEAELAAEAQPEPEAAVEVFPEFTADSVAEPLAEAVAEPAIEFLPVAEIEAEPIGASDEGVIGVAAMFEPSILDLGQAFDVVVSPDLLEEPLPGAGWESSLAPLADEDVEELFPMPLAEEIVDLEKVPVIEAPALDGGPASPTIAPPPSISTDDLKARIEETRRRIRRELDEPFLGEGDTTPNPETTPAPEIKPEPISRLAAEVPDSAIQDRLEKLADAAEAAAAPAGEPEVSAAEEDGVSSPELPEIAAGAKGAVDSRPQPDMELGVDYNAMRTRIEETRGRLKAKAFDAMMTGESALLGRDSREKGTERPEAAVLDHDLEQTIETTLREEEDI